MPAAGAVAAGAAAVGVAAYSLTNDNRRKLEQSGPSSPASAVARADLEEGGSRLRARKLGALRDKELSASMMRSLFRLLDADGSFELSPGEVQQGMLLLGFKDAADPVAMTRLLQDIDEDRTGTITEGEFMGFFTGESRSSVSARLRAYVTNAVSITATFFGTDPHTGSRSVRTESVPPHKLADWIASQPPTRGRLWLDVVGYSPSVHATLAASLGMRHRDLAASILFQEPTVELVQGAKGAPPVAKLIVRCMSCSSDPLVDGGITSGLTCCRRGGDKAGEEGLDGKMLASKAHIETAPPSVSMEQATLIVPDDRTLVTLRSPAFQEGSNSAPSPRASSTSSTVAPESVEVEAGPSNLGSDPSAIKDLYYELRTRMSAGTVDTQPLFSSSIKALAVHIIDMILQKDFELRDGLTDWEEVLEREIRKQPNSLHTPHIEALRTMAKGAANALEPLVQALDPANWKDVEEEGTGEDGADKGASGFGQEEEEEEEEVAPTVPLLRAQASRKGADLAGASLVDAEGITEHPSTLKSFFAEHLTDFREMKSDTAAIEVAVRDRADAVQDLAKLLASLKADFMNRTLFALTLITAVSVPVTFLTGLWGMNFEDMTELQDPAAEGSAGFGYKTFWISVMSVIVFELVFMTRLGLFEALK